MSFSALKNNLFLATLTLSTLFVGCADKSAEKEPAPAPKAPTKEVVTQPADTTDLGIIRAEAEEAARIEDSIAQRKVPDNAFAITSVYAIRTGQNDFAIYRARNAEKPFITISNAENELEGTKLYKKLSYSELFARERDTTDAKQNDDNWAVINLFNGTIEIQSSAQEAAQQVFQIVDAKTKEHLVETPQLSFLRTGDKEFKLIDQKYPDKPLFVISNAKAKDLSEETFAGKVKLSTGPLTKSETEAADHPCDCAQTDELSYQIDTVKGTATLEMGEVTTEYKIIDKTAPAAQTAAKPVQTATPVIAPKK